MFNTCKSRGTFRVKSEGKGDLHPSGSGRWSPRTGVRGSPEKHRLRYAIRKRELNKDGQALFVLVKDRDSIQSKLSSFSREVRVGEFLAKLTFAYHQQLHGADMTALLREGPNPIKFLAELEQYASWGYLKFTVSSAQRHITATFLCEFFVFQTKTRVLTSIYLVDIPVENGVWFIDFHEFYTDFLEISNTSGVIPFTKSLAADDLIKCYFNSGSFNTSNLIF